MVNAGRAILWGALLFVALAGGVWWLAPDRARRQVREIEQWVGRQVASLLEAYVTPSVEIASIQYLPPRGVNVNGLALRVEGRPLLRVDRIRLELAEVPRVGEPIVIASVEFGRPAVHLARDPSGGLVGWSRFLRPRGGQAPPSQSPQTRLSDVLRMHSVVVRDGAVVYEGDGPAPMRLAGIEASMRLMPPEAGAYAFEGIINRDGLLRIDLKGGMDFDAGRLHLEEGRLSGVLGESQYEIFPPPVQAVLRRNGIRGQMDASLSCDLALRDPASGRLQSRLDLTDAAFAAGEATIPISRLSVSTAIERQRLDCRLDASLLDGSVEADGVVDLVGDRAVQFQWQVKDVELRRAFESLRDRPPPYAGRFASRGIFTARLADWPQSISGSGRMQADRAKLVQFAFMRALRDRLGLGIRAAKHPGTDQGWAEFDFKPDHLWFKRFDIISVLVAARGRGKVHYNGRLDIVMNAGPAQKIERELGQIGSIIGQITDKLISYDVRGTVGRPEVSISPPGRGLLQ